MKELLNAVLNEASYLGANACDARITLENEEAVHVRNGMPDAIGYEERFGLSARVRVASAEGFASTNITSREEAARITRLAFDIAKRASSLFSNPKRKIETSSFRSANLKSPFKKDPLSVSVADKISLLNQCHEEAAKVNGIVATIGHIRSFKKKAWFANLSGADIYQEITSCGAKFQAYALIDSELQVRSYPSQPGNYAQKGYEFVEELELSKNAQKTAEEAVAICKAKPCPPGEMITVIASDQMALQVHESVGHPIELDRVLGHEVSLAGASYLSISDLKKRVIASSLTNIVADTTYQGGMGSYYYDDEGTPAQRFYVVREGVLENFLSSVETADMLSISSNGCARSDGAHRIPIVRMTNLNLLPGNLSFEELLSDIKEGIYLETVKSWSIDDLRLNFQFAVEVAREIKNGRLGKYYKNANYSGITPYFWKNLDALGDESTFSMWGFTDCGKGDPMQVIHVGHGAPAARFKKVKIGCSI